MFQQHLGAARTAEEPGRWPDAVRWYEQAISLYRGNYLAEDLYVE